MTIKDITDFYKVGIWRDYSNKPQSQRLIIASFRMLILTIESFTTKRMINNAAALTYSTLLAIVPILAVVFAIARGFGYNKYIEEWFRNVLSSQPYSPLWTFSTSTSSRILSPRIKINKAFFAYIYNSNIMAWSFFILIRKD